MTNTISPFSQTPLPTETTGQSATNPTVRSAGSASAERNAAASQSDSVTLSEAAQTTTQLLDAARAASGIDQAAIDQIRGALAAGTYNVAPEDLAQAIALVLKETNS
jgi:flagellar biosynthesis anti-sigma factor FlgM